MMNALLWYNLIMADKITWSNERRKLSELIPWDINPAQIANPNACYIANERDLRWASKAISLGRIAKIRWRL